MTGETSGEATGDGSRYEVVIRPDGGYEKEHAHLLRKRLVNDGFHGHVVFAREVDDDE